MVFGLTVFGSGYLYLDSRLQASAVSNKTESVPYYSTPENSSILFEICNDRVLINLDFDEGILKVIYPENTAATETEIYGYRVDYTVSSNYDLVGFFVDSVGGIVLEIDDETLRYTGVQISEMLEFSNVSEDLKQEITEKIISGLANTGFTKENLLYITQNTETDLKFSTAFPWLEYISELCKFTRFIN